MFRRDSKSWVGLVAFNLNSEAFLISIGRLLKTKSD